MAGGCTCSATQVLCIATNGSCRDKIVNVAAMIAGCIVAGAPLLHINQSCNNPALVLLPPLRGVLDGLNAAKHAWLVPSRLVLCIGGFFSQAALLIRSTAIHRSSWPDDAAVCPQDAGILCSISHCQRNRVQESCTHRRGTRERRQQQDRRSNGDSKGKEEEKQQQ